MSDRTEMGEVIIVNETRLKVLTSAAPNTRDGIWRIRTTVMEGKWTGQEGWLTSEYPTGPWEIPGAGFV